MPHPLPDRRRGSGSIYTHEKKTSFCNSLLPHAEGFIFDRKANAERLNYTRTPERLNFVKDFWHNFNYTPIK